MTRSCLSTADQLVARTSPGHHIAHQPSALEARTTVVSLKPAFVVEAFAKRDSDRAGKLMYEHAMESRDRLHEALKK